MARKTQDDRYEELLVKLTEVNSSLANSVEGIKENIRVLNDANSKHQDEVAKYHISACSERKEISNSIGMITNKLWVVISILLTALLIVVGVKEAINFFS